MSKIKRTRAQESRAAIEKLYVIMRHLFIRGGYKPLGVSGSSLFQSLLILSPEIYGSINDDERVEMDGLMYVLDRLPKGIEECRYIRFISKEGLDKSGFKVLVPSKRRRNCYRIDKDQMYIELTRGRSDIYDILTHLTFLYVESEKIKNHSLDTKGIQNMAWEKLEEIVKLEEQGKKFNKEIAYTYLSTVLGRTFEETVNACEKFAEDPSRNSLFRVAYWLGKVAIDEEKENKDREITFSATLRERIGHHVYGEQWAQNIKAFISDHGFLSRPIHIISANLHSTMNSLYAYQVLRKQLKEENLTSIALELNKTKNEKLRSKVESFALKHGLYEIPDNSGTNLTVQIIDTAQLNLDELPEEIKVDKQRIEAKKPILLIMDYAFGEQAFETMDELLRPYENNGKEHPLKVDSISIMGKAGILQGEKGDIMVPTAHIFEGTADNYPIQNEFSQTDFEGQKLEIFEGPMVTVLGTSLQNKDVLEYFARSSWGAIGLEMEGAHYQKAIQSASKIRKSVKGSVTVRYAYYASDNPLVTGKTLASGSLGEEGVKPTYLITTKILSKILG
ncbi:hypothetical protein QQ008_25780 [Fulvivirgaceae bacterium BMA10]|uniref:Uncharacterized protein n=1 Tax=Splendidivirga corallicola TaxID=3051826 RepID=A0ABT8KY06_9BACT|nr:hypothetical protein [Fulvivirgaceae bacterium BMA10]